MPPTPRISPRRFPGSRCLAADADLLHATTGGFPLYVIEAVRGTADPGGTPLPAGDLQAVLRKRFEQATTAAREVAGLAAAVGTNFTLDLLTEASDLEADIVVAAVDELWRRRIMREFRDGYDFSHDLLREAAYAQVSPPKRWLLHRRVAQGLELLHADDTDAVAAQLAEQYARGGQAERAVAYYRRAADVAAGMFAHAEAIRLHRQALSIMRRPAGGQRPGLTGARDPRSAWPHRSTPGTATRPRSCSGPWNARSPSRSHWAAGTRRSPAWSRCSGPQFVQGRTADGYQMATRALSLVDPGSELSGQAHFAVGGSAVSLGMPAEGLRHLELAAKLASGGRLAERRHPARCARHGLGRTRPLAAGPRRRGPVRLPRGHRAGPGHRPPVQPGRGPGLRLHHPPDAPRPARAEGQPSASCASYATGMTSPTTVSGG